MANSEGGVIIILGSCETDDDIGANTGLAASFSLPEPLLDYLARLVIKVAGLDQIK